MKSSAFSFLFLLGVAAQAAWAEDGTFARPDATSGYGLTSGASAGMQSEAGTGMSGGEADLEMPQPQTRGDVTYLCGGIGKDEASYMQQQARNYDMKISFAAASGAYLADVDVDIRGPQGESILQVNCDAPIMLVDVPASGTYRIVADADGFRQTQTVRVQRDRPVSLVALTWPSSDVARMRPEAPAFTGGVVEAGGSASGN